MKIAIKGIKKDFLIDQSDALAKKIAMLIEGQCTIGVKAACEKYGYTQAWYYQALNKYKESGSQALINKKPGSEKKPVRTDEILMQIIRMRFSDPLSSAAVISQKLNQAGYEVSTRSVERTITEYGLQKKLMSLTLASKSKKKKYKSVLASAKQKS